MNMKEALEINSRLTDSDFVQAKAVGFLEAVEKFKPVVEALAEAAEKARAYLEQRGIRTRGTVGRTEILPALDKALAAHQRAVEI